MQSFWAEAGMILKCVLKVICKGFSQNWWKVDSSGLLQYKCVCVIDFDKLHHEILKIWSLMVILVSLAILGWFPEVTSYQDQCVLLRVLFRLRWDSLLFKEVIYFCISLHATAAVKQIYLQQMSAHIFVQQMQQCWSCVPRCWVFVHHTTQRECVRWPQLTTSVSQ